MTIALRASGYALFICSLLAQCSPGTTRDGSIPHFSEIPLGFAHRHDEDKSLSFVASAVIDLRGDGHPFIFVGGGYAQEDALFAFRNGAFVNVTGETGFAKGATEASMGAAAVDLDGDGMQDLIVARETGLYAYLNHHGQLIGSRLNVEFPDATPLSITAGDVNRDGYVDLYISTYIKNSLYKGASIFNDPSYGPVSLMLLGGPGASFRDATMETGLYRKHNTFTALLVDLDNDGWLDLAVAQDTGTVKLYRNVKGRFEEQPDPTGFGYPMGIAVGDFHGTGRMDLFFSNSGSTFPDFMIRGDLRDRQKLEKRWILLRNDGNFKFTNVAQEWGIADLEFSWGAVAADFDLDGFEDLVVAENFSASPVMRLLNNPGRFLVQRNRRFIPAEKQAGVANPYHTISPIVVDVNGDGRPDLIWINLGAPARAFINGSTGNSLTVALPEKAVGSIVKVTLNDGRVVTRQFVIGQGLCSDQSHDLIFGLGKSRPISLEVRFPSGEVRVIPAAQSNTRIKVD
ncbi:MAG: CRTAC1 family protein [Leptospirales bacterium]|nr:CRTAC1 family protein [Leptospirales bacterium]